MRRSDILCDKHSLVIRMTIRFLKIVAHKCAQNITKVLGKIERQDTNLLTPHPPQLHKDQYAAVTIQDEHYNKDVNKKSYICGVVYQRKFVER